MFPHSFGLGEHRPPDHVAGLNITLNEDAHTPLLRNVTLKKVHCSGVLKASFDLWMTEVAMLKAETNRLFIECWECGRHMHSSFIKPLLCLRGYN